MVTFVATTPEYAKVFPAWIFVIGALVGTQLLDPLFTKKKEYSKSLHMSFFGNLLWLVVTLAALASGLILSKNQDMLFFITEGMFLFTAIRIGLFTTVLGQSLPRAVGISFIQPLAIFLALVPMGLWEQALSQPFAIGYGAAFIVMAIVWSTLTDRAGRPEVKSTHKSIQAYLSSLKNEGSAEVESLIENKSQPLKVSTVQIKLTPEDNKKTFRLVLPDIHPGPFHPVGGSNIPFEIYEKLNSSAMVMHSISDHSLNLPSKKEVENYLNGLKSESIIETGTNCSEPVTVQINNSRVIGLRFGKTVILFLSASPHGMEDIPIHIRDKIDEYSKLKNFEQTMLVDCHNAMGGYISDDETENFLDAAKTCIEKIKSISIISSKVWLYQF